MPHERHFDTTAALAFYRTLGDAEIRRRQGLCEQQTQRAYEKRDERALADLQAMSDTLTAAMMERTG